MKAIKRRLVGALGVFLFAGALWILHRQLHEFHYTDLVRHLNEFPRGRVLAALFLTLLNYFILTLYDLLAFRHIRHPLPYKKIALAAYIGNAFSNNISLSGIAGGSVRYRLYSAWGLSTLEITQVIFFYHLSFILGFCALGALAFISEPNVLPQLIRLPFDSARWLGYFFAGYIGVYTSFVLFKKTHRLKILKWEFNLPSQGVYGIQLSVALAEWIASAAVLYALLAPAGGISFLSFCGIFLVAQLIGFASQVPGGLGVFETGIMTCLNPVMPAPKIFAALLVYRMVYYLFPFFTGIILLGLHEILEKKKEFARYAEWFGRWLPGIIPQALAFTTFLGGVILLFSGATPPLHSRLLWLRDFLPLPVIEMSHLFGSLAGVGLLLLARGLQRRLDGAYIFTLGLLSAGIVFSLLKGFDYEEAAALSVMLFALLPCQRHFHRKASLFEERFTSGWVAAIVLAAVSSIWIGLFAYKHVEYSHELWWQFSFDSNAPRFLRASMAVSVFLFFFCIRNLLSPAVPEPMLPNLRDLQIIQGVIARSRRTYANLALLGDKEILLNHKGDAFIMFGIQGRSWISLGDPVGPREEWDELIWRFRENCDRYDGWPVFYEVDAENLTKYVDLGFTPLKIGEEAIVNLTEFTMEGGKHKEFRHLLRHLEREGCSFEVIQKDHVGMYLEEFRKISDAWMDSKKVGEKGFSMGYFDEIYLQRYAAGIVRRNEQIIAFTNIWAGADRSELSVDLMRYKPESPRSIMDFLFLNLMIWGRKEGFQTFDLGMAPLAGLENRPLASFWTRVGAFVFSHGEPFYNFQGLRQFKSKFYPEWRPKYLASPAGLAVPGILTDLATLISGGIKSAVTKKL